MRIEFDKDGNVITGPERSIKQVAHRLAGCWRAWGEEHGYFTSKEDAQAFYDEIAFMILRRMSAAHSPCSTLAARMEFRGWCSPPRTTRPGCIP